MAQRDSIGIGLLGLGVVGSGVAETLLAKADLLAEEVGCPLVLRAVAVRDPERHQDVAFPRELLSTDPLGIAAREDVDIVIEVMGGDTPALECIRRALTLGKPVVTANKEVIAKYGPELLALAQAHGTELHFEASVGGGIPLIAPFEKDLLANRITAITAIINGTTNYILTRMARQGLDFAAALAEAQALGYAEADPTNDIEGYDAAYKLSILATLGFHTPVRPDQVYTEGISRLNARDFRYAQELGYTIKLLAIARESDGVVEVRVHPALIPQDRILAGVDGVFNAVLVEGDLVGQVLFYGRGAGALPTSSAVVADTVDLARRLRSGVGLGLNLRLDAAKTVKAVAEVETRYYLRLTVPDRAGVLAQIARVCGDNNISIASVIQKETDEAAQTAELVIMTHLCRERAMQQALAEFRTLPAVLEVGNVVRVES